MGPSCHLDFTAWNGTRQLHLWFGCNSLMKPYTKIVAGWNIIQNPAIGMITNGHKLKPKVGEGSSCTCQIVYCINYRVGFWCDIIDFMTDKDPAVAQSFEPFARSCTITAGIRPCPGSVVMTGRKKAPPDPGNLFIVETYEVAGNGSTRKATEKYCRRIASILRANVRHSLLAERYGHINIAPPLERIFMLRLINKWKTDPNASLAARNAETEITVLHSPGANVAVLAAIISIPRIFDNDREGVPVLPVNRQIQREVYRSPSPLGKRSSDPTPCSRFILAYLRALQIRMERRYVRIADIDFAGRNSAPLGRRRGPQCKTLIQHDDKGHGYREQPTAIRNRTCCRIWQVPPIADAGRSS